MPLLRALFEPRPQHEHLSQPKPDESMAMADLTSKMHTASLQRPQNGSPKTHRHSQQPSSSTYSPPKASFWSRTIRLPEPGSNARSPNQNKPLPQRQAHPPPPPPAFLHKTPSPPKPQYAPYTEPFQSPSKPVQSPSGSSPRKRPGGAAAAQCSGTTSAGRRCTRTVNPASPSKPKPQGSNTFGQLQHLLDTRQQAHEEVPLFCHQHAKQALADTGIFAGPSGLYTQFDGELLSFPNVAHTSDRHG